MPGFTIGAGNQASRANKALRICMEGRHRQDGTAADFGIMFRFLFAYAGWMGHSKRKEAWEIAEAIRDANRTLADTTLGQLCANGCITLNVGCYQCARRGRYRITRLIDQHSAGMTLLALKDVLTANCPKRGGSFFNQCGAHFPGLNRKS